VSGEAYRLGLTGYPLGHSLSPAIHNAALAALGLAGEYGVYPVPPLPIGEGGLIQLVQRLRTGELSGLNITIPHKTAFTPWLDELTTAAREIKAVNTLYMRNRRLVGDNTDAPGFLADLTHAFGNEWGNGGGKTALVLGAGGSARAVVYALRLAGWRLAIAARSPQKAILLAEGAGLESFGAGELTIAGLRVLLNGGAQPVKLVVNTTPQGMSPEIDASPWPSELAFPDGAKIYDLVYNPAETQLMRRARENGHAAVTGLGMLVEQAALAFERWTGSVAPRLVMLAAAQAALERK